MRFVEMMLFYFMIPFQSTSDFQNQFKALRNSIDGDIAIVYRSLNSEKEFNYNENSLFHAASLIKTAILYSLYTDSLYFTNQKNNQVELINQFKSIVDLSYYSLKKEDDSDPLLYDFIGQKRSIAYLAERMISHSSNLATNILIEFAKPESIKNNLLLAGIHGVHIFRGVEDIKAFRQGSNNQCNAKGMADLFSAIYYGKNLSDSARKEIIEIHLKQAFNEMLFPAMKAQWQFAHKTGSIRGVRHDAGIMFSSDNRPFIFVFLSKNLTDETEAMLQIQKLVKWLLETVHEN